MKVFGRFNGWLEETDSTVGIWIYNLGVWWLDNVSCPISSLLWYRPREWWCYHHYQRPLYAVGKKLMSLNLEVMPDAISIRTWTRLGMSLVCEIRFMKLDEEITVGSGTVTKNGDMACVNDGKHYWVWLYRNYERYVIAPKGMSKESDVIK